MKKLALTLAGSFVTVGLISTSAHAYEVKDGDTMNKIAKKHKLSLKKLESFNPQIEDVNKIYVGEDVAVNEKEAKELKGKERKIPKLSIKPQDTNIVQHHSQVITQEVQKQQPVIQQPKQETTTVQNKPQTVQAPVVQSQPAQVQQPKQTQAPTQYKAPSSGGMDWNRLAQFESGGNPRAVSPDGLYHGLYQFDVQTWHAVGGSGLPSQASPAEQTKRAQILYNQRGSSPWPSFR